MFPKEWKLGWGWHKAQVLTTGQDRLRVSPSLCDGAAPSGREQERGGLRQLCSLLFLALVDAGNMVGVHCQVLAVAIGSLSSSPDWGGGGLPPHKALSSIPSKPGWQCYPMFNRLLRGTWVPWGGTGSGTHLFSPLLGHLSLVVHVTLIPQYHLLHICRGMLRKTG